jgi:hypothetical protein
LSIAFERKPPRANWPYDFLIPRHEAGSGVWAANPADRNGLKKTSVLGRYKTTKGMVPAFELVDFLPWKAAY